jgi:EAL domain-containing protein (putative c-di-GMP-specific phosphodiesterase class I)
MHPELGLVSPGEFIPLAEDLDWIGQLDDWMIEEACRQVASWHTATPVKLSVNVSARHLGELNLVAGVSKALSASGLPPAALRLEVTETAIYDNPEAAKDTLGRLRGLGVSIAMDDFGTGYASFGSVAEMPLDALKIDRSFVARLPHDRQGVRVIGGVIGMATQLGLDVVAEGVESAEQLEVLRTLSCGFAQGHYFAHPLTAADARKLLAEATRW